MPEDIFKAGKKNKSRKEIYAGIVQKGLQKKKLIRAMEVLL